MRCRMDRDGARWIEELPAGLAAQQGLLRRLGEEQRAVLPLAMGRFVISDLRAAVMS